MNHTDHTDPTNTAEDPTSTGTALRRTESAEVVAAAVGGDESAFTELAERYRHELRVHCYRMLGSFTEAEDLVQETLLRAWRGRDSYAGTATFRAWLYRIATNACLDVLDRRSRDPLSGAGAAPGGAGGSAPPPATVPGLQPYPDHLLEPIATEAGPDSTVLANETIELAFLVAIQQLPARQRAVLILRDVLGWPASEVATLLETTVASVNSALQRARPTLRWHLPQQRTDWSAPADAEHRQVLRRYMTALERADHAALGELLRADVRCSQQPWAGGNMTDNPVWYQGRDTMFEAWAPLWSDPSPLRIRTLATAANRQPAFGMYVRAPEATEYAGFALSVLRITGGRIAEISVFHPDLLPAFHLPATL